MAPNQDGGFRLTDKLGVLSAFPTVSFDCPGPLAPHQNACSSFRHASLKSRNGSTCLSIQLVRISCKVMFGARYVSTMMRTTVSAASTTSGEDRRRIRLVRA